MDRRKFLFKCGTGLAGIIAAGKAPAYIVHSLCGADGTKYVSSTGGWENPYVKNGLVAMWDGEWNADGGKHDSEFNGLKDLSGNKQDISSASIYSGVLEIGDDWFCGSEDSTRAEIAACAALRSYDPTVDCLTVEINFHDMYPHFANEGIISIGALRYDYPNVFSARWGEAASSGVNQYSGRLYFGDGISQKTSPNAPSTYNRISIVKMQNTYSSSGNTSELDVYYNGVFRNKYTNSSTVSWGVFKSISYIQLFNFMKKTGSPSSGVKFRNVMIYNRNLNADEIAYNYSIDKERFGL